MKSAAVVAEDVVGDRLEQERHAVRHGPSRGIAANPRVLRVPRDVVADVQVEVAVAVEVGERRRRRPAAVSAQPPTGRHVLECAVATVSVQRVRPEAGDEEIGSSVVVHVADGGAVPVAAGHGGETRARGHVFKGAVALVAEQPVAVVGRVGPEGEGSALHGVDVEPAVAVVIQQRDPAAHGLGELPRTETDRSRT